MTDPVQDAASQQRPGVPRSWPARVSLLLADVDGTLVTHDKVLTPRAQAAVTALHDLHIRFAVTSGRPPRGMTMFAEPLKIDAPIAAFNGGIFTTPDLTVIEARTLARDVAESTLALLAEYGLDVWVYSGNDWFLRDADAPHVAREQWTVRFPPTVVGDFAPLLDHAVKIVGISDDLERVRRCESAAQMQFAGMASAARSQPYYLDVTHPAANKGEVVEYLSRALDIPAGGIVTIGDMPNDILMFQRAGFGIAMANAAPDVQHAADAVTDSCDDEGFARAVERFILHVVRRPA
jgi:Cof subfamily protein (haloacid dehalogenase superfamily)